jgi:hypothetical protein
VKKKNRQKISDWFTFDIDRKSLVGFAKLSVASRLQWLEEANVFLNKIASPAAKKRWRLFREGKI